jgi:hypothetical protein
MANEGNSIWDSINRLLVVVKFDQIDTMSQWRDAIKILGLNIHNCKILSIVNSKKERLALAEMTSVVYLSDKDFGFFGGLKNDEAQKTLNDRFDAVLVVGEIPSKIEKLIQKVSTTMDIGLNSNRDDRMINLRTDETAPKYMLNFVKQTLEKIS